MRPVSVKDFDLRRAQTRLQCRHSHVIEKHPVRIEDVGRKEDEVAHFTSLQCRIYTFAGQKSSNGNGGSEKRILRSDKIDAEAFDMRKEREHIRRHEPGCKLTGDNRQFPRR